ncbi:hypothetical protein F2Q69_00033936 [Brassica cretica]|uniref:Uncharacterized protein n=1 Tax=Brassica cretica TaxID=69181 RepID=A0A8S9SJ73_BRACR|nr:hypothetical protein F2Q69_00033936 [Brassica cretica]
MNFTSQRFLTPSICEYPILEGDSSLNKERPEAKTIIGVKRSLLTFQKAQDQENWPRKLGVMINFPKPAKPTPSMESLQPIQLGSTQSYLWEPGDHLHQSGGNWMKQLLVSVVRLNRLSLGPPSCLTRLTLSLRLLKVVSLLRVMFAPKQNS